MYQAYHPSYSVPTFGRFRVVRNSTANVNRKMKVYYEQYERSLVSLWSISPPDLMLPMSRRITAVPFIISKTVLVLRRYLTVLRTGSCV